MKKALSLLLCAVMLVCSFVVPSAAEGLDDVPALRTAVTYTLDASCKDGQGVLYTLNDADNTAVVGLNTYADSASSGYTDSATVIIPEFVSKDGKTYSVIAIGRNAFDTTAVKEVIIGNNVQTIGEMAFAGCEQLERVVMGTGVKTVAGLAFWHCTRLVDVSVGENVETIGGAAFWSCVSLTNVTIPVNVTTIMEKAFWNCTNLVRADMLNHCPAIGAQAFDGCADTFAIGYSASAAASFADVAYNKTEQNGYYLVAPTVYGENGEKVTVRVLLEANAGGDSTAPTTSKYNGTVYSEEITVTKTETKTLSVSGKNVDVNIVLCDHANTAEIITVASTCNNAGEKQTVCTLCHKVLNTETIDQLTHSYQELVTEPTCVDGGYTTHKCTLCGDKHVDTEVEALGHSFVDEITAASTWSFQGTMKHTCERCKRVENEALPFTGDVNNDGKHDLKDASAYIKHFAGYTEIVFVETIADLNADGKVNLQDTARLIKKLAGWDVTIGA